MQLSDVNLTDPDIFEQGTPHEMFALLRRESPVHWHEESHGPGFFAITKYQDLKHISKNPLLFSSNRRGTLLRDPEPELLPFIQSIMLNMDPPQHQQYRNLINRAFTPRMVNSLHGRIQEMVQQIIDDVIERGECDFVEDVAAQLPLWVICEMMGVPEEDRKRVYEIGNQMVGFDDPELQPDGQLPFEAAEHQQKMGAASAELFMYADKLRKRAQNSDEETLAAALVNVELEGRKLTEQEFQFFFLLLLIAGNETTRTVTSNGMIALLDNPEELDLAQKDPTVLNSAVEEILRYAPAVHTFRRQVTADTEVRGVPMKEDQKVMLWYPSANRDEDVFHEPDRFDVRRKPNEHVAFGVGEHFCLGANLARMELREIFRGIFERFRGMEPVAPPRRLRSCFINGVKEMQVRFEPGPKLG